MSHPYLGRYCVSTTPEPYNLTQRPVLLALRQRHNKRRHWLQLLFAVSAPNLQSPTSNWTKLFNKVMHEIDAYGKDEDCGSQFWEELQDAYNSTMHRNFMPLSKYGQPSFSLLSNLDDDKVHYNHLSKRKVKVGQESKLKHV